MNALRLVMIAPRYWPLVGETERFVSQLVQGVRARIAETTVVAASWDASWPNEVVHQETRVVRLPHAPRGGWNRYRYMRSLTRWLSDHSESIDVVYVMNLRHDAYTALGALRNRRVAVVLRPQLDDCEWLGTARPSGRMQRRAGQAEAMIVPTRALEEQLLAAGYARQHVFYIANGVTLSEPRTAATRFAARAALAAANPDLGVAEFAPLAVTVGRLTKGRRLFELVDAWREIAARWPAARLWFLGDGPRRQALYERIVDAGLQHQVFLPGTFDELIDVFHAADVLVATDPIHEGGQFLIEAMSVGLPVVAGDTSDNRDIMEHGVHGLLVSPGSRVAWTRALETLLGHPQTAAEYGAAARIRMKERFSQQRMVDEHLQLFDRLVLTKRGLG